MGGAKNFTIYNKFMKKTSYSIVDYISKLIIYLIIFLQNFELAYVKLHSSHIFRWFERTENRLSYQLKQHFTYSF